MSLLNNTTPTTAPNAAETGTKHNNSEYQKKQRELLKKYGKVIADYVASQKNVPADVQEAAEWFKSKTEPKSRGSKLTGKPAIYKIFGDAPKAGDKKTALEVFEATGKGYSDMRSLIKKWAKDGIVVDFDEKAKAYTIKSGTIAAYKAE